MEDERVFGKFIASLKRKWLLVVLVVFGIGLVVLGGGMTKDTENTTVTDSDSFEIAYREDLEQNIAQLCKKIKGAGEVSVMITLSEGNSYTYSGGKLVAHRLPTVQGVAIICEGGDNERVKGEIIAMVSALLNVGTHRIYVGKSK